MRTLDHEMKGNGETDIYQRPLDRSRRWSIGPWRNTNTKQILAEKGVNFGARNRCGEFTNYIGETVRHSNSHGRTRDFPEISVVEVKYVRCQKQCQDLHLGWGKWSHFVLRHGFMRWSWDVLNASAQRRQNCESNLATSEHNLYASLGSGGWKIPAAAGCAFSFILRKTNNI